jgi:nucleoside-diphosphate-sugar epimerase
MSKVLITGGTGFIGKNFINEIINDVDEIYLLIRKSSKDKAERMFKNPKIKFIVGDITKSTVLTDPKDLIKLKDVDKFIHMAASYDLADDEFNAYINNVVGTQNIIRLLKTLPSIKYFFYISSYVVNSEKPQIYSDDDIEYLSNENEIYALTKNRTEILVREIAKSQGIKTIIFRPGIVIGSTVDENNFKSDGPYYFIEFLNKKKKLLSALAYLPYAPFYYNNKSPLPFIAIDYLVRWMKEVVNNPIDRDLSCYHMFDRNPITTQYFMDSLAKKFKLKLKFVAVKTGNNAFKELFSFFKIPHGLLKYMSLSCTYKAQNLWIDYPHLKEFHYLDFEEQFFKSAMRDNK